MPTPDARPPNDARPTGEGRATTGAPPQNAARGGLLTVAEVAGQLRVSTMTVYRLIRSGELAALRIGRSYRLRPGDVDQFLAHRFTQAG
jgi:excisionase family DNA binding protein